MWQSSTLYASPEMSLLCQVNGTHLIYSNELRTGFASQRPEILRNSISRSADVRIAFYCVYHYDRVVSLPYPLLTSASYVLSRVASALNGVLGSQSVVVRLLGSLTGMGRCNHKYINILI